MLPPGAEFDRLYEATYPRILRTLAAMLGDHAAAEDCTQDAYLKAFRSWHTWRQDAPVETWLHRIAINAAISYRRKRVLREVGEMVRRLGRPEQRDPTDHALGGDLLEELRRLPAKQAAAIVLRHLHGYSNREIAASLGVPESTVATRLMIAKRTLRARLRPAGPAISNTPVAWRVPPIE
ncbi:MAG: RNA polymerase sigma factor [Chloroflexi bacterium]|nr:MAG: RNA polymerase sigma factor [Chloroflexota bacterium]